MPSRPVLLVLLACFVFARSALASDSLEWRFKVFLDEKEIGYHNFEVEKKEDVKVMKTEASFDVKVLFFNAFRYRHQTTERWQGDRLLSIASKTDRNGDSFRVEGRLAGDHFLVSTQSDEFKLPERVMTFAYWKPIFLEERRLLNAQTGEYEEVAVTDRGLESFELAGDTIQANRFDLRVKDKTISVWYAADDQRWLALETPVKGGRSLRYEPVKLPDSPDYVAALGGRDTSDES